MQHVFEWNRGHTSGEWESSQSKMKWSIKTNHQLFLPLCFKLYTLYWLVCELHFVIESVSWLHHSPSTSPLIEAFQPTELLKCQLGLYLCFYREEKKPNPKYPGIPHPLPHWPILQPTVLQPIVDLLGVSEFTRNNTQYDGISCLMTTSPPQLPYLTLVSHTKLFIYL